MLLTAADRCDRCGAQAYTIATLKAGTLYFCAHHGNEYMQPLRAVASDITLETVPVTNRQQGQP